MRFAEAKSATDHETGLKFICVHIHPSLADSSRSEDSQLGPAGGMTSDRSVHFPSRSHVNIYPGLTSSRSHVNGALAGCLAKRASPASI